VGQVISIYPYAPPKFLLGEEESVEKFKDFLEDKRQVKEIPRPQRYVSRPSLDKIFRRKLRVRLAY
jgi:hypothetical protein